MEQTTLHIQNLKCGGCAHTISTRLAELEGITDVVVDNDADAVSFSYSTQRFKENAVKLLSSLGYPVQGEANSLSKKAKSFVSCAVGRMKS